MYKISTVIYDAIHCKVNVYAKGQDDQNLVQVGGRVVLHVGT